MKDCKKSYCECGLCGSVIEDLYSGICRRCIVKAITIERGQRFIQYEGLEGEFYLEFLHNSKFTSYDESLICVITKDFDTMFEKTKTQLFSDFIEDNYLSEFAEFYRDEIVERDAREAERVSKEITEKWRAMQ